MTAICLFLADLEAFDPHAPHTTPERRFCCPLCGEGKPKDAAHRCFNVNTPSGAWNCKRCGERGKLADSWEDRPKMNPRDFARQQLRRRVCPSLPVEAKVIDPEQIEKMQKMRARFEALPPLQETRGAAYLRGRGVSLEVAQAANARFDSRWMPCAPEWENRAAVVFPVVNRAGELVAAQGRYVDGRDDPKTKTSGPKSQGVFIARTLDGFSSFDAVRCSVPLILTEAPIDALSLAEAGFAAIAFCGKTGPIWLSQFCFGLRVLSALDADEAGDKEAEKMKTTLESIGAFGCKRLRPEGAKDWNEFLTLYGRDALADFVAPSVLSKW